MHDIHSRGKREKGGEKKVRRSSEMEGGLLMTFYRCVAVKTLPLGTDVEIECVAVL